MLRNDVKTKLTVLIAVLLMPCVVHAQAEHGDFRYQQYVPYGPISRAPDWQWFAPVQHAGLTQGPHQNEGYFFTYERLNWWLSKANRAPVGVLTDQPVSAYFSPAINYQADAQGIRTVTAGPGFLLGAADAQAQVNSIDVADPNSLATYGNRFEFGYVVDDQGWLVSVLDGLDWHDSKFYGLDDKRLNQLSAAQGTNGINGILFFNPNIGPGRVAEPVPVAPVGATAGIPAILPVDGLLTVHVLFDDPFNLLAGFVDQDGDGVADDLNLDGVLDENDFSRLAVVFDQLTVRNSSELDGVEIMAVRRKLPTFQNHFLEVFLGARYLEFSDRFDAEGLGGILADSYWSQRIQNRMVGPQFGFRASKKTGRWTYGLQGRAMFGANFVSYRQDGEIASLLTSGSPSVPYRLAPTRFFHTLNDEKFSPVGEFRADAALQLTRDVSFRVGWSGLLVGGVSRASNSIVYRLPTLGISPDEEEIFVQGVNFGFEINR